MSQRNVTALVEGLFSALRKSPKFAGKNDQELQMLMMANIQALLAGDWTSFDDIQQPVYEFTMTQTGGETSAVARESWVKEMADAAQNFLAEDPTINVNLGNACNEDAQPIAHTHQILLKHLRVLVDLLLDYNASCGEKFSTKLKRAIEDLSGEWLNGLATCMKQGEPGLAAFLQSMSFVAVQQFTAKYPQQAMQAMFGIPMGFQIMTNCRTAFNNRGR